VVHIFFPDDPAAHELARTQELARTVDSPGEARMPGLEQRAAASRGFIGEQRDLPRGGGGRFLEHHVFARAQCGQCRLEVCLRWRADRNALEVGYGREHRVEIRETRNATDRGVAARAGREVETGIRLQCGNVLIARDLADA
jgi:hypothetical protein